jgi:DNA adenine methylase
MGKYRNAQICDSDNLRNVSLALRRSKAHIVVADYKNILLLQARRGAFIYLDPPYQPISSTAHFTAYTHNGFYDQNQIDLCNTFKKLDRRGCKVLLSNSDTPFIRELYHDYKDNTIEVHALRAINCKGTKRTGHKELLIRNYNR